MRTKPGAGYHFSIAGVRFAFLMRRVGAAQSGLIGHVAKVPRRDRNKKPSGGIEALITYNQWFSLAEQTQIRTKACPGRIGSTSILPGPSAKPPRPPRDFPDTPRSRADRSSPLRDRPRQS